MATLRKITIEGYKSIKQMSLELRQVNVLIGANGAGKSNLLSFFRLRWAITEDEVGRFVALSGGANAILHYGAKTTRELRAELEFTDVSDVLGLPNVLKPATHAAYRLILSPTANDAFVFSEEQAGLWDAEDGSALRSLGTNHPETRLRDCSRKGDQAAMAAYALLRSLRVYHFHDTSAESRIRQTTDLDDNLGLHSDGSNLAAMLYRFRGAADEGERVAYFRIVETFRQLAPWFGEFVLEADPRNPEKIRLRWRDKGSDVVFGPHILPDGALRAIALIALLLQPREMLPRLIVIDEPELGLHPSAINALAGLVEAAACHCQVIIATQSVNLLDEFDPEDVIVVDREGGSSTFKRVPGQMSPDLLKEWLDEYSLSELWEKNVIGGGPL